jgi:hypothetical protein
VLVAFGVGSLSGFAAARARGAHANILEPSRDVDAEQLGSGASSPRRVAALTAAHVVQRSTSLTRTVDANVTRVSETISTSVRPATPASEPAVLTVPPARPASAPAARRARSRSSWATRTEIVAPWAKL